MVDTLKKSVERLEPPVCPDCHIEMMWYRAIRTSRESISHFFMCSNCSRVLEMKTRTTDRGPPPPTLSRPSFAPRRAA